MPWKIVSENGQHCVHKENPDGSAGKLLKCYDDEGKAKQYMKALYANVHNSEIAEFSMYISKASLDKKTQQMRWNMVTSDTDVDLYGERMSKELYEDMISRIENGSPIPAPFDSVFAEENWNGGMPYLSISHYKSAAGKNVPGSAEVVYVDGEKLKAKGILYDTPLGRAVFNSLLKDLYGVKEKSDEDNIRVSIGFIDLAHSHGDETFTRTKLGQICHLCSDGIGDKIYRKGQLVHLALTRVPVNPRTEMEVEKMDNKSITRKEDAESIIGDLANELEDKSLVERDNAIVVKNESEVNMPEPATSNTVVIDASTIPTVVKSEHEEEQMHTGTAEKSEASEESGLDKAWATFRAMVMEKKESGATGPEVLKEFQDAFNELGKAVKSEFVTEQEQEKESIAETIRSIFREEVLPVISSLQTQITEVKSQVGLVAKKSADTVVPRSLSVTPKIKVPSPQSQTAQPQAGSKIRDIARRSVGIIDEE